MDFRKSKSERTTNIDEEERLEIVDLSGMSLESLPNPCLNLRIICKLDLSNNNLQNIPESLTARLLNMIVLDVHSNQLKYLPNSIGCLSRLKILDVSGNLLQCFPATIENCRSLEEVNANFNKLRRLPEKMGFELSNLKKLYVNSNKLLFLPQSITRLTFLRVLDVSLNCLQSLPEDLENLIRLEILNVSLNFHHLENLPYSLGLLISLVDLDVSYNRIAALPNSMGCLRKLQHLRVEGNPLVSPPMEVVEQGLHAVKEFLSQQMNGGQRCLHKKRSWVNKLVRYGTFHCHASNQDHERETFILSDYHHQIDTLASPRSIGMFSPRRLFSPRTSR